VFRLHPVVLVPRSSSRPRPSPLGFPKLPNDLLRTMSLPLHRESPGPSGTLRLSGPVDQFLGSRPCPPRSAFRSHDMPRTSPRAKAPTTARRVQGVSAGWTRSVGYQTASIKSSSLCRPCCSATSASNRPSRTSTMCSGNGTTFALWGASGVPNRASGRNPDFAPGRRGGGQASALLALQIARWIVHNAT
jgi:hypothetical protein